MISLEKKELWEAQVAAENRKNYSDEALWEMIFARQARQEEIERLLPKYYANAHGAVKAWRQWRPKWDNLVIEYDCNNNMIGLIVRHLKQRGDTCVEKFVREWQQQHVSRLDNPNVKSRVG